MANHQIYITENGTTTLATAGKYCDRNIDVNVATKEADAILDGSFSGAYYSDKITSLKTDAFSACKNVTSVSLPNCTAFTGKAHFYQASNLKSVYLPNLTTIENPYYTFGYIKAKEINLPSLTTITATAGLNACFYHAELAEKISIPKLGSTAIGNAAFYYAKALTTLILCGSELNPLENVNAFVGTPIAKGTGYVYVPDDLVDTYKTATNWVTYADQIKPISELEE